MLSLAQLHIDAALTNVSVNYSDQSFVGEELAPVIPVDFRSNKYFVQSDDVFNNTPDDAAPGTPADEIEWSYSTNPYFCTGHKLAKFLADEDRSGADPVLDLDIDATQQLTQRTKRRQEINLATLLFGAGSTLPVLDCSANAGAKQFDNANTDPVATIDAQRETILGAIGQLPNRMFFSRSAWRGFRNNPNVLKHIYGSSILAPDKQIDEQQAAKLLEVEKVVIGDGIYKTSNEGQASTTALIWGKNAMLYYKPKSPGKRVIAVAYQFFWDYVKAMTGKPAPEMINGAGPGWIMKRFREESREGDKLQIGAYYDQRVVVGGAAVWFKLAVA